MKFAYFAYSAFSAYEVSSFLSHSICSVIKENGERIKRL